MQCPSLDAPDILGQRAWEFAFCMKMLELLQIITIIKFPLLGSEILTKDTHIPTYTREGEVDFTLIVALANELVHIICNSLKRIIFLSPNKSKHPRCKTGMANN